MGQAEQYCTPSVHMLSCVYSSPGAGLEIFGNIMTECRTKSPIEVTHLNMSAVDFFKQYDILICLVRKDNIIMTCLSSCPSVDCIEYHIMTLSPITTLLPNITPAPCTVQCPERLPIMHALHITNIIHVATLGHRGQAHPIGKTERCFKTYYQFYMFEICLQ